MMDLKRPIAVVAHDAGAANLILSLISASPASIEHIRPVMHGPAASLWATRFPHSPADMRLADAVDGAGTVISGTGWASTLEHDARRLARGHGIRSIAVVDHWVNYRQRFVRAGEEVLPDELWVSDEYAAAEAGRTLPEVPVILKPNLYLEAQAAAAGPPPADGDILFVLEPARSDWGRVGAGEFQALDWFWQHRDVIMPLGTPVRLRPHPSDAAGKYDDWISRHPGSRLDLSSDLSAALRTATAVVGLQSAAQVVALAAGRRTWTALPPWAPPCPLPHDGIETLPPRP
ncbi:MAG: hypothetical protein ACT6SD_07375 [Brevundimonas sp.]|uniref:hypothetical protein n=2 Tax=Brevundimonas sp. TaxID=1871086 RepID=UPI00403495F7